MSTALSSTTNQKSSTSSGTANSKHRVVERHKGIPKNCRCGAALVIRTSTTADNPGRLFYRCPYGTKQDKYHLFQWTDEVVIEELEILNQIVTELKSEIENLEIETRTCEAIASSYGKEVNDMKESLREFKKEMEDIKHGVSEIRSMKNMLVCGVVMAVFYYCIWG